MDKKLEARICRLERFVKNESAEINRVAKDSIDNIMIEIDTLDTVADKFGEKFVNQLYKVKRDLGLLDKMVKMGLARDIEISNEIW